MKRISCIFLVISHLFLCVAVPVCCVLEYYAWMKMGMYRYLVLKNAWWLKNVFTVETMPFILTGTVIIMLIVLFRYGLPIRSYSFSYGTLVIIGSIYLFRSSYFFSLRAATWFGVSLILSEIFFVLSMLTGNKKNKDN